MSDIEDRNRFYAERYERCRKAREQFAALGLSTRSVNSLIEAGIHSIEDLANTSPADLLKRPMVGVKTLKEIESRMESAGLHLSGMHHSERPAHETPKKTIARLSSRIRELEQAQRWIPVTERMPEVGVHVLACKVGRKTNHGPLFAMACKNEMMPWRYIDGDRCDVKVSHWQPLPELPQ